VADLRQDLLIEIDSSIVTLVLIFDLLCYLEVLLEVGEAELVAGFKLAEVVGRLLDGVVRQMNEFVAQSLEVVFFGAGPQVAFFIEIASQ